MADENAWQDVLDVNLTGVYHTVDVAMKPMIKFGNGGGAIVLTSSVAGLVGLGSPVAGRWLRRGQARCRRPDAGVREFPGTVQYPGELGASRGGEHPPDDRQRVHSVLA